jgi:clan AA aspartic protease
MGEIRVKVRLTNAVDEALSHRGDLAAENVRACEADAMVDTGAVRSVVPATLVNQLGLEIRGTRTAQLADGSTQTVGVTGPLLFEMQDRETLEEALVLGDEVLIGQTVLEKLDLLADCVRQRLLPAHAEGPISKVKRLARAMLDF